VAVLSHGNPLPSAAPAPQSHTSQKPHQARSRTNARPHIRPSPGRTFRKLACPAAWPAGNAAAGAPAAPRSANVALAMGRGAATFRRVASGGRGAPSRSPARFSCVSGHSVEGVWVQAARGSAFCAVAGTREWLYVGMVVHPCPRSETVRFARRLRRYDGKLGSGGLFTDRQRAHTTRSTALTSEANQATGHAACAEHLYLIGRGPRRGRPASRPSAVSAGPPIRRNGLGSAGATEAHRSDQQRPAPPGAAAASVGLSRR